MLIALLIGLCCAAAAVNAIDCEALLKEMTLEEKIGQMVQINLSKFMIGSSYQVNYTAMAEYIVKYNIGSLLNSPFAGGPLDGKVGWNATEWRQVIIEMQKIAMNTGAQIPIVYGIDSIHGATYINGAALFPQALGTAAAFDTNLTYQSAAISARDTRAAGIPWLFAPVLGLGLQPYWPRFPETFGEDMYLAAQMGAATVLGMQDIPEGDEGIPKRAAACMKHFISYSDPVSGQDVTPVQLPDRIMRELYFPSFYAAVKAGVMTAMESYNEVGGVPMVSSRDYLITLLRTEMNFTGMLVTDWAEIEDLHNGHKVAASQKDAVQISMTDTSIDMSMVPEDESFYNFMIELVNAGKIPMSRVDESVLRILQLKDKLGLFDDPIPSLSDPNVEKVGQAADWAVSQQIAEGSVTLVQNNAGVLPLSEGAQVFLTGPTADCILCQAGGWSLHWQGGLWDWEFSQGSSLLQGMQDAFTAQPLYLPGPTLNATEVGQDTLNQAYALIDQAEAIVVAVGEGAYAEKLGDIDDLNLAQGQLEYVLALRAYAPTKPLILVIISGRPRLLHQAVVNSDAVINAYAPGPVGGAAIARILMGAVVPSGRQPYTYPRNVGDIPYHYHHKPGDVCTNANGSYVNCEVEWEFGHGLSYVNFTYSDFILSATEMSEQTGIEVSVTVTNNDPTRAAAHSVLMFVYDLYRRVTPEYKLLKGFQKATLLAGESKQFTFSLSAEDLQYVGIDSRYILEGGSYVVGMGADVDCRSGVAADQLSMYGGANMCAGFNLSLSDSYSAVCEYGCALWTAGLCGVSVEAGECASKCAAEQWTWNYVDCLQQYAPGSQVTCSGAEDIQCYDAFAMIDSGSDDDKDDKHRQLYITILVVVTALACFLGGAVLSVCFTRYYMLYSRAHKEPFLNYS